MVLPFLFLWTMTDMGVYTVLQSKRAMPWRVRKLPVTHAHPAQLLCADKMASVGTEELIHTQSRFTVHRSCCAYNTYTSACSIMENRVQPAPYATSMRLAHKPFNIKPVPHDHIEPISAQPVHGQVLHQHTG